ncbi:thiamine-binding protein [archaeon]|nr:MAG: thiamine-binding protein [archaeon]
MIVSITVIPVGTSSPSLSQYIAKLIKMFRDEGYTFKLTDTASIFEISDFEELSSLLSKIYDILYGEGIDRVVTVVIIDERRDKELKLDKKIESVLLHLGEYRKDVS